MIRSLVILIVSLAVCCAGQVKDTRDEIHLRAKVLKIGLLADFSGKAFSVDFDPRFALTVRIRSAVPEVAGFSADSVVTFAIHSPSLLFQGDATTGDTYDFLLRREIKDGKTRFLDLEVRGRASPVPFPD